MKIIDALFRPSSLSRRKLCAGSLALESSVFTPGADDRDNADAAEGKLLHQLLAEPKLSRNVLDPSQLETMERAEAGQEEVLAKVRQLHPGCTEVRMVNRPLFFRERRGNSKAAVLMHGTADEIVVFLKDAISAPEAVACTDWKMGRKEVPAVESNLQIRAYLCMLDELFGNAGAYYGAIVQPWVSSKPFIVHYEPKDIGIAHAEIIGIWNAAHAEHAALVASEETCIHCTAKPVCASFSSYIAGVQKLQGLPARQWTAEQWDTFLSRKGMLQKFLEERTEDARAILAADPDAIPGWGLKEGAQVRQVTDVVAAWESLRDRLTPRQFSDCAKLSLGDVERILWAAVYDSPERISQKEAKRLVNELLKAVIVMKQNKPSIERKEKEPQ